jgi:hypothetical protein
MGKPRNPSAQKYIKQHNPQAKSAAIKEAVDMLQTLKRIEGNPKAINAIGAQNLAAALRAFAQFFRNQPRSNEERREQEQALALLEDQLERVAEQELINVTLNGGEPFIPGGFGVQAAANVTVNVAPLTASYIVASMSDVLTNERALVNSATILWDYSVSGQVTGTVNVGSIDLTDIDTAIASINASIITLSANLDTAEAAIISLDGRLDTAEGTIISLDGRLDTAEAAIVTLDGDIDAVSAALTAHLNDTTDAHDASAISYAGGTGMSATDVEGALDELATAVAALEGAPAVTPGGSNTQLQFNDSGVFGGTAGFTFNKTTNNAVLANTFTVSIINLGANVVINTTALFIGNSTVNTHITANSVLINGVEASRVGHTHAYGDITGTPTLPTPGGSNTQVQFNDSATFGGSAGFTFDKATNTVSVANVINIGIGANVGANVNLTTSSIQIGNSTINVFANSSHLRVIGTANIVGSANVSGAVSVGSNVTLSNVALSMGNSTVNTFANSSYLRQTGNVALGVDPIVSIGGGAILQTANGRVLIAGKSEIYTLGLSWNYARLAGGNTIFLGTDNLDTPNFYICNGSGSALFTVSNTGVIIPTTGMTVGANMQITTVKVDVGNSTVNTVMTAGDLKINGFPVGMLLLANGVVSSAATLDIPLTSYTAFRGFHLVLANFIPATDATDLWIRFSTNGGSSYDAGASDYRWAYFNFVNPTASGAVGETAGAKIGMFTIVGSGTAEGVSADIKLYDPFNTAVRTRVGFTCWGHDNTDGARGSVGSGFRLTAQDTDAIRIMFSSGNITSGKWAIYGYV